MRAVRISETGGPEVLQVENLDDPAPARDEVVVEVVAAGVNFIDVYQREGRYPLELPTGLGSEGAGTVIAVGADVHERAVGDRVAWAEAPGSYAERVPVRAERTVRVPAGVELETAGALMLQGMTAHYLSHSTYHLDRDDTALVYAAAGGVGRLLVQLAKRRGARVIACTSTDEKAEIVRELGADEVVPYRSVDVVETVRDLTSGRGVDVVYDSVGADTFESSLDCLKPRGHLVLYGASSGAVPPVDPMTLARKGSLFLTRPSLGAYVATADELQWRAGALFDLVASGQLSVAIHERYTLDEAGRAHGDLASGTTTGKLLLIP